MFPFPGISKASHDLEVMSTELLSPRPNMAMAEPGSGMMGSIAGDFPDTSGSTGAAGGASGFNRRISLKDHSPVVPGPANVTGVPAIAGSLTLIFQLVPTGSHKIPFFFFSAVL